jgi:transmembrane sensor
MSERETAQQIDEAASAWVARLDAGLDGAAQTELAAWRAVDPRREGALLRAEAAWRLLDDAGRLSDRLPPAVAAPVSRRRLIGWGGGLAAGVAGLGAAAVWGLGSRGRRIETARGEIRRVPLQDGSLAMVNTESRVAVDLTAARRAVRLPRGEAWFQVAKDPTRPFVVEAGPVRVQAVGTAFSVRRRGEGAEVQVTEGIVEVWSADRPEARIRISAGASAYVADKTGPQVPRADDTEIDRRLAWRTGQIILDGDTLGAAAEEFNRYNDRRLVIDDPALAGERLFGRFRTNEPDAFARAAAGMLGAELWMGPEEIRLGRPAG